MKTLLKATVASIVLLGSGAALASDLPSKKYLPLAPALPKFYDWTGVYVGGQIGYSWGRDRLSEFLTAGRTPLGVSFDYSPSSFVAGAHLGFNYQIGSVVLGVEGDIEGMNARGGFNDPPLVRSAADPGGVVRVQQDWQGSVRARIGYAFDRFMVYGSAGAAFTKFEDRRRRRQLRHDQQPDPRPRLPLHRLGQFRLCRAQRLCRPDRWT
jgi:outer membrane immunogenic protein